MNAATQAQKLFANVVVDPQVSFICQKTIPEMVATTDNLYVVEVMRVDCWETNTAVVHLTSEDFISEEVVAEKTTIAVGEVM